MKTPMFMLIAALFSLPAFADNEAAQCKKDCKEFVSQCEKSCDTQLKKKDTSGKATAGCKKNCNDFVKQCEKGCADGTF